MAAYKLEEQVWYQPPIMFGIARVALLLVGKAYQKAVDAFMDFLIGQVYRKRQQDLHRDEDLLLLRVAAGAGNGYNPEEEDAAAATA